MNIILNFFSVIHGYLVSVKHGYLVCALHEHYQHFLKYLLFYYILFI